MMQQRFAYTKPEMELFNALIKNKINFVTQFPILVKSLNKTYIVDFLVENKLIVEVDGIKHRKSLSRAKKDKIRDKVLRAKGFSILRFTDEEILNDMNEVIKKIKEKIKKLV